VKEYNPREDALDYLQRALRKHAALGSPQQFVRNPHEKVSLGTLLEELKVIYQRDGEITWKALQDAPHSASTYSRRIGGVQEMRKRIETLIKEER
jgi:hypothetical protein